MGDLNGSLVDNAGTNVVKSQMLRTLANDCNIAVAGSDFHVQGEQYSFYTKTNHVRLYPI